MRSRLGWTISYKNTVFCNLDLYVVTSVVNLYVMVNTEQTFFNANDAVWPALSSLTGILLRWIVLTWIGWNCPSGSGPSNKVSFSRIVPRRHVPDTTVPTPWKLQKQPFGLIPFTLSLKTVKMSRTEMLWRISTHYGIKKLLRTLALSIPTFLTMANNQHSS